MKKLKLWQKGIVFFIAAYVFCRMIVGFSPVANWLAEDMLITPELRSADVIITLGAGVYPNSYPNPVSMQRGVEAIILWRKGLADKIIFSGAGKEGYYSEAESMARMATALGVPENSIISENHSGNTYENAQNVTSIMKKNGWDKALLVTSPLHMKRATRVFEKLGIEVYSAPTPSIVEYVKSFSGRWGLLKTVIHEYLGMLKYRLEGWI